MSFRLFEICRMINLSLLSNNSGLSENDEKHVFGSSNSVASNLNNSEIFMLFSTDIFREENKTPPYIT